MTQRPGLEEEGRQGAGREERGKERRWLVEWEASAIRMPLQAPKVRAKRKKEECSSQPQILLDAEFLFGCHRDSPA